MFRELLYRAYSGWKAHQLLEKWKAWRFHNTAFLLFSFIALYYIIDTSAAHQIIGVFAALGYLGAFIAGMLLPSMFTAAPSIVLLYGFAEELDPYGIAVVAGLGAMLSDLIIFQFFRDNVVEELQPLFERVRHSRVTTLFHTPYFAWLGPVMGMVIIASPLPDEVGLGMLGASSISRTKFLLLGFILNSLGILAIVLSARLF